MVENIIELFGSTLQFLNIGAPNFRTTLESQGQQVIHLKWMPPDDGENELLDKIDFFLDDERIEKANAEAVSRFISAVPMLIGIERAGNVIPDMTENTILHSGPPITWDRMCGPMRGAIIGALIYERRAKNEREAEKLASSGNIVFSPCHEHGAVGPMAGVISPSMPVHIIENKADGNKAYCTVNEGLGKVLRFGAFDESVINRLDWIETGFAPVIREAILLSGGIDLKAIIAQAVQMGDECHNRNKAATGLFFREIVPWMLKTKLPLDQIKPAVEFIKNNDHYFLNLSMPSCKVSLDASCNIPYSTIVTAMARNGVDFGIKVSGLGQDAWFTAPANFVEGLLFPGYGDEDANPDLGDSAITETAGIGGFAMGASPAITQFVGGTVADALQYTRNMYQITTEENKNFCLPPLDFRGTATGIDILKVLESGIIPIINTGIAHKIAGVGQIGAGIVSPPKKCFVEAMKAYCSKYAPQK
ncbi:MAG: DUF1116 domain-containing protein [Christensenellaceae bacterium]